VATKTKDERTVRIAATRTELASILGSQAKELGLIDFDPDTTEVYDQGDAGFEVVFTKETVITP
jgi:hypothetical protein